MPLRLDMKVDLFDVTIDGSTVLMSETELHNVMAEIRAVEANWPEPKSSQLRAALLRGLRRSPDGVLPDH